MADKRAEAVQALRRRLGHDFRDPALLDLALTHASVGEGAERDARGRLFADNQRLEFLGDRVLGLLVIHIFKVYNIKNKIWKMDG
jgi:ribonuclease-3